MAYRVLKETVFTRMRRIERLKKQKKLADKKQLEDARQQLEDLGQVFTDYELPPDEVDEKEVRRSILTSIRTFIPYTNEWYEAKAAEEELDDLKKIKIEKVKAADLLTMSKVGRHDEALDQMMSETNYDFFYFNKLKFKMENEGKFKFEFKADRASLSKISQVNKRNRLRKAVNTAYGALDEDVMNELSRMSNVSGENGKGKVYDKNTPCNWRGKSKNGENLRCSNVRMVKPLMDEKGLRRKNEPTDILPCCSYHTPHCVGIGDGVHTFTDQVKIKIPNMEALCSECYMGKFSKKPQPFMTNTVPGVVSVTTALAGANNANGEIISQQNTDVVSTTTVTNTTKSRAGNIKRRPNECQWIATTASHPKARGYDCTNDMFVDPVSKQQLPTCAWHITQCIRFHRDTSSNSSLITVPNALGLCTMHYQIEVGQAPPEVSLPYPGMVAKLAKDHWKTNCKHFATPKEDPPPHIVPAVYKEPERPVLLAHKLLQITKLAKYKR